MELLYALVGVLVGAGVGFVVGRLIGKAAGVAAETENRLLRETVSRLETELKTAKEEQGLLAQSFKEDFKHIANEILDEKTRKVQADAKENLETLLKPLQNKLSEFQGRLEQNMQQQYSDNKVLQEKIRQLTDLNQTVSAEAKRLTEALRGEAKTRGNWGELVLEKILEASGLRRDKEYRIQVTLKGEAGAYRPDVIVYLPENKHIVIDSKVSLVHFERLSSADANREELLKSHCASLRSHVKDLAEKGYSALEGVNAPDFVFMFVPIEAAFLEAMNFDPEIYDFAFQKKVILLSPSTLLAALKLVQNIWRQEEQNRNAQQIARQGALLYDKFAGFVDDLQKVGTQLDTARDTWDKAFRKLSTGRGNLLSAADKLRDLGVQPAKKLPVSSDDES
jgi:DNA recombination protein RmuC